MKANAAAVELIKRFEGCRLDAYQCPAGIWTIGVGHTGDVAKGQRITQHQADVLLAYDLDRFEDGVTDLTSGLKLTENQFGALICFAFNLGVTALANSTLLKKLRRGDVQGAADEFPKWVKAAGKVLPGLVARRAAERELFLRA